MNTTEFNSLTHTPNTHFRANREKTKRFPNLNVIQNKQKKHTHKPKTIFSHHLFQAIRTKHLKHTISKCIRRIGRIFKVNTHIIETVMSKKHCAITKHLIMDVGMAFNISYFFLFFCFSVFLFFCFLCNDLQSFVLSKKEINNRYVHGNTVNKLSKFFFLFLLVSLIHDFCIFDLCTQYYIDVHAYFLFSYYECNLFKEILLK